MRQLGNGLWVQHYSFRLLGANLGKTVTVMRLRGGEVLVHSGGPWAAEDRAAIRALGPVHWVMEATRTHDSYAGTLRRAFPDAEFLLPPRFPVARAKLAPSRAILPVPAAWGNEIEVLAIEGIPVMNEHVLYHRPSRTLVVADLVFNLAIEPGKALPFFLRWVSGFRSFPGTSRLVRLSVRDRQAVRRSVERMLAWDFTQVVVGHGQVIETDARAVMERVLAWAR